MQDPYRPEAWHELFVMGGGAAAALMGLIFVAVSLQLRAVVRDPWRRGTAASSVLALMTVVLLSGVMLTPPQPPLALGIEITVISAANPVYSLFGLLHMSRPGGGRALLSELLLGIVVAVLAAASGISVATETGPGLWLLLPGAAVALTTAVFNAWRLMVGIGEEAD